MFIVGHEYNLTHKGVVSPVTCIRVSEYFAVFREDFSDDFEFTWQLPMDEARKMVTERDDDDELQVPAVCGEASRPVSGDDDEHHAYDDACDSVYDSEGDGIDGPDDCGGDEFTDYYIKWSEYERTHRFDNPIED